VNDKDAKRAMKIERETENEERGDNYILETTFVLLLSWLPNFRVEWSFKVLWLTKCFKEKK